MWLLNIDETELFSTSKDAITFWIYSDKQGRPFYNISTAIPKLNKDGELYNYLMPVLEFKSKDEAKDALRKLCIQLNNFESGKKIENDLPF